MTTRNTNHPFRCLMCGSTEDKVIDSRENCVGVRRRRECLRCGKRFTTVETRVDDGSSGERIALQCAGTNGAD